MTANGHSKSSRGSLARVSSAETPLDGSSKMAAFVEHWRRPEEHKEPRWPESFP